jgi:hypothetical protein
MKLKTFLIILAILIFLSTCKSPESPDEKITQQNQTPTTGTISGTVTDASTSARISGASVSTQPTTTTVTTNAQGNFTISNVSPGAYTVTASVSGYSTDSTSITVTAGQTAIANLALQPATATGTISGTVTDEGTGMPIVGASVSTQPGTAIVTTDAQGSYTISDVSTGLYTVTASASGYLTDSTSITVTAGQTAIANLALQPATGTISGTVTDEGTGMPIVGASVSTQPGTAIVTTDAQGSYTISDVLPGFYTVTASASGYTEDSVNVSVTAGQTTTADLILQADYSGSWSGTTSQGKSISFTVVPAGITQLRIEFRVSGFGCTVSGTITFGYPTPKPISGNTFTFSGSAIDLSYSISGTFDSTTTASGTMNITTSGGCSGSANFTWSAIKN